VGCRAGEHPPFSWEHVIPRARVDKAERTAGIPRLRRKTIQPSRCTLAVALAGLWGWETPDRLDRPGE
jgi:hypothetical protein